MIQVRLIIYVRWSRYVTCGRSAPIPPPGIKRNYSVEEKNKIIDGLRFLFSFVRMLTNQNDDVLSELLKMEVSWTRNYIYTSTKTQKEK